MNAGVPAFAGDTNPWGRNLPGYPCPANGPCMEHLTPQADRFSFWTHAGGALAGTVVLVLMVLKADGSRAVTATAVYGATLVLLFSSSSFHHIVGRLGPRWHGISRRLDHIAIYLLIAGTYTPVCLLALSPGWGWSILGVIWGLALAGSLMKAFWLDMPRWLSVALYIAMGWIVIVAVWPLSQAVGATGLWLLGAGGVAYSGGAIIYASRRPDPWPEHVGFHGIWHLFVLAGAAAHAVFIGLWVV